MAGVETLLPWIAALYTVFTLSFIYKDNQFFRFAEHTVVGAAAGNSIVMIIGTLQRSAVTQLARGDYTYVIPLIIGVLLFTRLTKYAWLSRYPVAMMVGVGTGLSIRSMAQAQFIGQIQATILPVTTSNLFANMNNLITMAIVFCTTAYFTFTFEHKGGLGIVSKIGRYGMMVAFGAGFSTYLMQVAAVFIERLTFLWKVFTFG